MDLRIIKPVKAFVAAPDAAMWQSVSYWQRDGSAVIDYMTTVQASSVNDPAVVAQAADAIMVSAFNGAAMVYTKAPPAQYAFLHHFAGTQVAADIVVPPIEILVKPLRP